MKPLPLLAAIVLAPAALAQHRTLVLNPNASQVSITLNTTHEVVHGSFHVQSGSIVFDPASPALSGVITVSAASGNTGNGSRDHKMKKDILKDAQYATITFHPQSYTGTLAPTGDSNLQVTGTFTLLGTPHDITVPMQIHLDQTAATAKGHFTIPYVQWGLKNPSFLFWKADNTVAIDLNLTGILAQ